MSLHFIPMVDLHSQWTYIRDDVHFAIDSVASSGNWILGNYVKNFEISLSNFWRLNYAVGCASGLDGIEIGLRALEISKGDRVITTPLTAYATTLAIIKAGGVPVYIDTDDSGLLNLDLVNDYLKINRSVKFMVPVHLYGHSLNLNKLLKIKETYNLLIIEDCAQSICATSNGIMTGSVGQIAATSFYPTKNLGALGDAGAIITNCRTLMERCRVIRDYGQREKYHHEIVGLNSRLDEIHAAILDIALLPKLISWNNARKVIANRYLSEINNSFIKVLPVPKESESSWHLFPILVSEKRNLFQKHMSDHMIGTGIHYPVLCNEQPASKSFNYEVATCGLNNATRIASSVVSLPINPYLTDKDVTRVIDACNSWRA